MMPDSTQFTSKYRRLFAQAVQFVAYAMIAVLFVVWIALGPQTVSKQNQQILNGVQTQLNDLESQVESVIAENTVGDRTIVCILNVDPDKRTEKVTQQCEAAARQGLDHLPTG